MCAKGRSNTRLILKGSVQLVAERLECLLPLLPNDIDLGVICNRLEHDVRHALIDEAVADVPLHRLRTRRGAGDFGFLELAFAGISQQERRTSALRSRGRRLTRGCRRLTGCGPRLPWISRTRTTRTSGRSHLRTACLHSISTHGARYWRTDGHWAVSRASSCGGR